MTTTCEAFKAYDREADVRSNFKADIAQLVGLRPVMSKRLFNALFREVLEEYVEKLAELKR